MIEEAEPPELLQRLLSVIDHRKGHYLLGGAEAIKVALTGQDKTETRLEIGDETLSVTLTRAAFAKMRRGIRAREREPWRISSRGRVKPAVLPVPVCAQPKTSRIISTYGIACSWIGVGVV